MHNLYSRFCLRILKLVVIDVRFNREFQGLWLPGYNKYIDNDSKRFSFLLIIFY